MTEMGDQSSIEKVVGILSPRPSCVALTGAGLSTRSCIPDFRSPSEGLWERLEKMPEEEAKLMTIQGFKENPEAFYQRFRLFLDRIFSAEPNPAHFALARLEAGGHIQAIVTQNGDMLQQKSGSQQVIEIHGTIARATCITCYRSDEGAFHWRRLLAEGTIPKCPYCGGVMKPDVILTGEQLPAQQVLKAKKLLQECEVILAAGTSFSGGPIMTWVEQACERGKKLVIINLSPTILDPVAEVVVRADVVEALPTIAQGCLGSRMASSE